MSKQRETREQEVRRQIAAEYLAVTAALGEQGWRELLVQRRARRLANRRALRGAA